MATSLQKGINAAKASRMDQALGYLKDAIIEEPQNAEVWVWIAAIIDDLNKQEIFLEKALAIDPNNIPAQRGLAYLQKRKSEQEINTDDHLSDHTRPISPFPNPEKRESFSGWSKISPEEILKFEQPEENTFNQSPTSKDEIKDPSKLTSFEIGLLAVVVIVFSVIGLLAASAIFEFELPISFLRSSRPRLVTEPPYEGVFLYENNGFFDITTYQGPPTSEDGIPTSSKTQPIIVFWNVDSNPERMSLIYQDGDIIPFSIYQSKGDSTLLQPTSELPNGLYCFQYNPDTTQENATYWCFNISTNLREE